MKNKESPLVAGIDRIYNGEYYKDTELDFLIKENIPNNSLALPAALSVADISEDNEIIGSDFREALRAFANESSSDQHSQLVAPISVNRSCHFAGLHIKRNADKSFTATYVDPLGAGPKPTYKLANTTITQKSNEDESAGLLGLLNKTSQYFGLTESKDAENLRISLNQVLPQSSIPFHIINALELELGIAPQEIVLTTTKIQHPSNNHCSAFTAEILTSLANESISISENRIAIGDDRKQIPDLDQNSSDKVGKSLRKSQAEALEDFFDLPKKSKEALSNDSVRKVKNTHSQTSGLKVGRILKIFTVVAASVEVAEAQGSGRFPTQSPSSSATTGAPTYSPSLVTGAPTLLQLYTPEHQLIIQVQL